MRVLCKCHSEMRERERAPVFHSAENSHVKTWQQECFVFFYALFNNSILWSLYVNSNKFTETPAKEPQYALLDPHARRTSGSAVLVVRNHSSLLCGCRLIFGVSTVASLQPHLLKSTLT